MSTTIDPKVPREPKTTPDSEEEVEQTFILHPPEQGTLARAIWNQYWITPSGPVEVNQNQRDQWFKYRDAYIAKKIEEGVLTAEMAAELKKEDDPKKLYRKVVADPGEFDGNKKKFNAWWLNVQLWMLGYESMPDLAKIIAVLTKMKTGNAQVWARTMKKRFVEAKEKDKEVTWGEFKTMMEQRFTDIMELDKARHDIHNFKQGKESITDALDRFENLRITSKLKDDQCKYLLENGLQVDVKHKVFSGDDELPADYDKLVEKLRKIAKNQDIVYYLRQATENPKRVQSDFVYPKHDKVTAYGTTYGGHGQAMEIDKTKAKVAKTFDNCKKGDCYNCGKSGHWSSQCPQPKKPMDSTKITCYTCNKKGHMMKDCPMKKSKNTQRKRGNRRRGNWRKPSKKRRIKKVTEDQSAIADQNKNIGTGTVETTDDLDRESLGMSSDDDSDF